MCGTALSSQRVILTSNAYLPAIGGVENSLRQLATVYQQHGLDVLIITSDIAYTPDFDDAGIQVQRIPKSTGPWAFIKHTFALYQAWRNAYQQSPQAHIIARYHISLLCAYVAGFRSIDYIVPSVVRFEYARSSHIVARGKQVLQSLLQTLAGRLAQRVWVFSDNMAQQCRAIGLKHLQRVVPGVDPQQFCSVPVAQRQILKAHYELPQDRPILLVVGRLVTNKGIHLVLDALALLPDAHLVIVGQGECFADLQQQTQALDLVSQVTFIGATQTPEHFYQLADMFVFSSVYEPFGQTLLEASCTGLPIVAFRPSDAVITATPHVVGEDNVTWSEDTQAQTLASAIRRVLDTPDEALQRAKAAQAHVLSHYTWEHLAHQLHPWPNHKEGQ